jgi:hypothetical protein
MKFQALATLLLFQVVAVVCLLKTCQSPAARSTTFLFMSQKKYGIGNRVSIPAPSSPSATAPTPAAAAATPPSPVPAAPFASAAVEERPVVVETEPVVVPEIEEPAADPEPKEDTRSIEDIIIDQTRAETKNRDDRSAQLNLLQQQLKKSLAKKQEVGSMRIFKSVCIHTLMSTLTYLLSYFLTSLLPYFLTC